MVLDDYLIILILQTLYWYFNKGMRDDYNENGQCMTPVIGVPSNTASGQIAWLWLGGQVAANENGLLAQNKISHRIGLKGSWGVR